MSKCHRYYRPACADQEDIHTNFVDYKRIRREFKMIAFQKTTLIPKKISEKIYHNNEIGENSLTIVEEKKVEDDLSFSSGDNEEKAPQLVETSDELLPLVDTHVAQCTCTNCDEVLSRFSECSICLEPLQCSGPCVCPWCGGMWCLQCTKRMNKCAWCRATLRAPATPCLALQRLVNGLKLPCRNSRRGCAELLTASNRVQHETECKYDTMICPMLTNCCHVPFDELATHIQVSHKVIAVYSTKIKILLENFQTKLKNTAYCKTKYKIILLHQKSAFIIKVCIFNYHVKVEVMRRKIGYTSADSKPESKRSEYCAVVEFQSKAICTKSAIVVENEAYGKKAEVQWNNVALKSASADETITVHVTIGKFGKDILGKT